MKTVTGRSRFHLPPVKGSRFIATVAPASSQDAALAVVAGVRQELSDARHHGWAFRLFDGDRARSSDDGEPGGSAGRPILAQIDGHELADLVVVVTRYFGGTKLGVGGLIRAYGGCAGKALDQAETVERVPMLSVGVTHAYPDTSGVDAVLGAEGLEKRDAEYGEEVAFHLEVPLSDAERVLAALRDITAGRVVWTPHGSD